MKVPNKLSRLLRETTDDKALLDLLITNDCLSQKALSNLDEVLEQIAFKRSSYRRQEKSSAEQKAKVGNPQIEKNEYGDELLRDSVRMGKDDNEFSWIENTLLLNSWLSPRGLELYGESHWQPKPDPPNIFQRLIKVVLGRQSDKST